MNSISSLIERVAAWAAAHPDIFAVLVVGSYGRTDPPPDQWSDLDLIVFVPDPAAWLDDGTWIDTFGMAMVKVLDREEGEAIDLEWLVIYEDGCKIDFVFAKADRGTAAQGADALMAQSMHTDAYARGTRILFDRAVPSNNGRFVQRPLAARTPLTDGQYVELLHRTWMEAYRAAKLIWRGDLYRAMMDINSTLHLRLVTLIEWHARATPGADVDMWYNGRNLHEWADQRVLAALPDTIAGYDAASMNRALDATLDLVAWMAKEIAEAQQGVMYPESTTAWVRERIIWIRNSADR